MPNKGNQGNRDQDTTPTGTSGRRPGGNEDAQEWSNEVPPPSTENPRRRNIQDDEDSGLGNRNTFR